uniref:Wall-associated receptor kinase galacturonan-binding domain-containing protein n=1 Tax=Oryza punctata TaxID=4537 RepID=A0A0E0JMP3_ORYPU
MPLLLCRRRRLLLPLLLLFVAASHGDASDDAYDTSMCLQETTTCGDVSIRYPFYFSDKTRDINGSSNSYCGYPGLAIDCDDGKPTLQLNGTEKYKVNYINYGSITNVSLLDQEVVDGSSGCPRVDHNVTFAQGSWLFFPGMSVDYLVFFLGCSITNLFLPRENTGPIPCSFVGLTGDSYVLPKDQVPPGNWSHFCDKTFEVPVLKYQPMDPKGDAWRKGGYGQVLRQGFPLSLNDSMKPANCTQCEQSKGRCGFSQAGEFIGCMCPNGRVRSLRCSPSDLTTGKPFVSRSILLFCKGQRGQETGVWPPSDEINPTTRSALFFTAIPHTSSPSDLAGAKSNRPPTPSPQKRSLCALAPGTTCVTLVYKRGARAVRGPPTQPKQRADAELHKKP